MRQRLGSIRIVEAEDRGLREDVGRAQAAGVKRIAFDLRRPPLVAFDENARGGAAQRERRRVEERPAGNDFFGLPDVWDDQFRRLSGAGALEEQFVFAPLITDPRDGFGELFPDRFDAAMQLIQQLRNRVIHDQVEAYDPDITRALNGLVRWCFLDVIAVLAPIGRAFGLTYVLKLVVEPAPATLAEVEALDFSGLDGPREVHYRVSSLPQLDDFSFVEVRL